MKVTPEEQRTLAFIQLSDDQLKVLFHKTNEQIDLRKRMCADIELEIQRRLEKAYRSPLITP